MIIEKYKKFWANSFNFKGKSTREDFWYAYVAQNILVLVSFLFALTGDFGFILMLVFILGSIPATYSLAVRRFRDINKKWYWLLTIIVPFIGPIWFLILMSQPSI